MNSRWPRVKLGKVMRQRKEFVTIDDVETYKRPRVKLHAQGIVLRDEVPGALIKTKQQQICSASEFLVAEIDAKVGGFGMVPDSLNGAIVSSHYFLFVVNEQGLDRRFLDWFIRTPEFKDQVEAQGSTNYAAIRPSDVLGYEIPLPPLAEQRRVVAKIDQLAAKIVEARSLIQQAASLGEALVGQVRGKVFKSAALKGTWKLADVAVLERGKFSHRPRNEPRFFGGKHPWIQIGEIESAGKYIYEWRETLNEEGLAISKMFPKGTILISIAATIGAVGILDFDCCVPDSIVGVTPGEGLDSEFLYHFFGDVRNHLENLAPQSAQKNINLQILSPLSVPKLKIQEQKRIVAYLDGLQRKVDELKCQRFETTAELEALLPSILDKAFKGEL